jgi:hypothetical protein
MSVGPGPVDSAGPAGVADSLPGDVASPQAVSAAMKSRLNPIRVAIMVTSWNELDGGRHQTRRAPLSHPSGAVMILSRFHQSMAW